MKTSGQPTSDLGVSGAALAALQAQIYRQVRDGGRPIRQLMTDLLDRRNLLAAWDRVRSADGSGTPGPDGLTADHLARQPGVAAPWLARFADDLYHGRFHPTAPRWIEIPKPGKPGQIRRLGLLNLADRILGAALKQILEPVLDPVFLPTSYGFRPGRSVPAALAEAVRRLTPRPGGDPPFTATVHLDVADCFDTIDHAILLTELGNHVADPDLLGLIEQVLTAGATGTNGFFRKRRRGLVQGSGLSPLLCNLALHPLDEELTRFGQRASRESPTLVALRYADDLLLLGVDVRAVRHGMAVARNFLSGLRLRLRDAAAAVATVEAGVTWLGARIRLRPPRWIGRPTVGYDVPDDRVVIMLERVVEMTTPPSARIDAAAFNLGRWIVSLNDQLRDWRQAYLFADNARDVFAAIDEVTRERIGALIQSVTGLRWREMSNRHRVRLPRGFWTWQVDGARLSVLSALAPHAPLTPERLLRRPPWEVGGKPDASVRAKQPIAGELPPPRPDQVHPDA